MDQMVVSSLGTKKENVIGEQPSFFIISPFTLKYRIWRDSLALLILFNTFTSIFLLGLIVKKPGGNEPADSYAVFAYIDYGVDILLIVDAFIHLLCVSFINQKTCLLEQSHWSIIKRYLLSFLIDCLSTFPTQWLLMLFPAPKGSNGLFYYMVRIMIVIAHIWRLKRVHDMLARMETYTKINYYFSRCLRFAIVTVIVVHCSGCIFCYIAATYGDVSKTWIGAALGPDIEQSSIWYRYFVSIYWSLTTLSTVGYGDIRAVNLSEMITVTLFMLFNMGLASYLIGGLTNLFAEASPTKQYRDIIVATSAFLKRNNLPPELQTQIKEHLTLKFKISTEAVEQQDILGLIPKGIGCHVLHYLFSTRIRQVYLFKGVSREFLFQLASEVRAEYFPPFADVVLENQSPTDFYIIVDGAVELIKSQQGVELAPQVGSEQATHQNKIVDGAHVDGIFGEIGVVCHRAQPLRARTTNLCQLLRIEHTAFSALIVQNPRDGDQVMDNLLQHLKNSENQILKDLFVDITRKHASEEFHLPVTLSYLAKNEYFCLLRGSLHQGRSPNEVGQDGNTALHIAANKEKDDIVELLLQYGANPNSCDQDGKTPLHIAANKGRRRIIDLLLQYGANPNNKDINGSVPLWEAKLNGNAGIITTLTDKGASIRSGDPAHFACSAAEHNKLHLLEELVALGFEVGTRRVSDGSTALHGAAKAGHIRIAEFLLAKGADKRVKDGNGRTPWEVVPEGKREGFGCLIG